MQVQKTYYAYEAYPSDIQQIGICEYSGCKVVKNIHPLGLSLVTYLFETRDAAIDFAIERGEFDTLCDDDWPDHADDIIFEVCESELDQYEVTTIVKAA